MNDKGPPDQSAATTIGYALHGTGAEHVLVMHDWNGDHTTYNAIIPYLDAVTFTYAFVDLRGYGQSMNITGTCTVDEIANDCIVALSSRISHDVCQDQLRGGCAGARDTVLDRVAENDPGLDGAAMKKTFLAWHPNAELLVIPNCGHYPMQECPPYFATVVERFLRRQIDCA